MRTSSSQMPIELASSATSSRARELPTADSAAASSSSATTEPASCPRASASAVVQPCGRGVVDGEGAHHVPGRRHQRHAEVGPDLPRGHRRQLGQPLVGRRIGDDERGAGPDDDRGQGAGEQRPAADHALGQPVTADDDVVVGEEGDLGVAGPQQAGGDPGEPVERRRAGDLTEQPARGRDPEGVGQHVEGAQGCRSTPTCHPPIRPREPRPGLHAVTAHPTERDRPCCGRGAGHPPGARHPSG